MKYKKSLSLLILLLYIVSFTPFNSDMKKVRASENSGIYTYYNADTTSSYNKYGIKGTLSEDNILNFDDCIVAVTSSGIYSIKNGISKEYSFTDRDYSYRYAGRFENNIYLLAKKDGSEFYENKLLVFNLINGLFSWENFSASIEEDQLVDLIVDNQGNKFFCIIEDFTYVFVKIDSKNSVVASISTYFNNISDIKIMKLKCDANNNIWFAAYFEGNDTKHHTNASSTLYSIENTSILTKLSNYGGIRDYLVLNNGQIWYIPEQFGEGLKVTNYINHYDKNGNLIKGYSVNSVDSVDVDNNGGIWILDARGVKKLENDKFVDKYSTPRYMSKLSIDSKGGMLVYGEGSVMLINGNNIENFKIDSFVRNNAYVTNDNLNNIKIISRDDFKYHNLMMTEINNDGSLRSNAVSILEDVKGYDEQMAQNESNIGGIEIDSENVNNKYYNSYKTAKVYNDETYVFAGDNELYQIKGVKASLYGNLSGKIYAIDIKENNNKPQLYAVSKEIKQDGNEIINIFLTSLGQEEEVDPAATPIPVDTSTIKKDNKVYYQLEKFLQDKNGILYIDVKEMDTQKDCLFKKVDDVQDATEDPVSFDNSDTYSGVFLNENGNIEYVMDNYTYGVEKIYSVYKVSYFRGNYTMTPDTRFDDQDPEFASQYENIQKIVRANDGTLFVLVNNKIYTKKSGKTKFELLTDVEKANSIAADRNGSVYIGTDGNGVICYKNPNAEGVDFSHPGVAYMNISKYSKQVPVDSDIEIMFNENLYVGANYSKITLKDKFGNVVPYSYSLNGSILVIKPEKLLYRSSFYTVTIPYNSVTDVGNRAFNYDYTFNFTTAGETIPPKIVKAGVDQKNKCINITLSEEIEKGSSFNKIVFTDINGKSVSFNASINGKILTVKYTDKLVAKMTYKVSIPASCVNDLEGNRLDNGYDLYFIYQ